MDLIHSLEKEQLPVINDEIHCTFKYHPSENEIFDELVGKEIEVLLIGYGFDGKNSGFVLQLPSEIIPYYINYDEDNPGILKVPHITASLAEGSKASETKQLPFVTLKNPIPVKESLVIGLKRIIMNIFHMLPIIRKILIKNDCIG